MKRKLTKEDVLTIPNALSVFRILLIPVFVRLYVGLGQHYAAVAVVAGVLLAPQAARAMTITRARGSARAFFISVFSSLK